VNYRRVAERLQKSARLYRRLRLEDRERFDALRSDRRKLAWEVAGRGWTTTIYCGNTTRVALDLLELDGAAA
jgi:hypothetical protein